jgi:hypothetical protein
METELMVTKSFCRKRAHSSLILSILLITSSSTVRAQEAPEYQLKAAFLCNFAKFVEWPADAFASTNSPLVIGVFGDNPFNGFLEDIAAASKPVNGHPLVARKITFTADLKKCHILFMSSSLKKADTENLLKGLGGVLTVSEMDGFTKAGGMINFFMEGKKIRFEINAIAAKEAGLGISSKLLMLARRPQTSEADPNHPFLCAIFP